jgi:hypothetical protein
MTQAVALAQQASTGVSQGFKNRIINGNMAIAQRGTSAVTTDESFPVDRFQIQIVNANLSLVQSSTAPTGFNYSTAITVTSTTSTNANDRSRFFQNIEGFNIADLGWGTANAKTVTVSFWARSTVAGTYSGSITNSTGARSYIFTYTLTANTWTFVTATIPGCPDGTWGATNSTGILVGPITLNCGSTYQGTAGSWIAGDARGTSGSTYLATSNSGAVFNVTGVQLEVGSTATSFDYRPYGTEFSLCERYFQKYSGNTTGNSSDGGFVAVCIYSATNGFTGITFPQMRTGPTFAYSNLSNFTLVSDGTSRSPLTSFTSNGSSNNRMEIALNWSSNLTNGFSAWLRINTPSGFYSLSAEL